MSVMQIFPPCLGCSITIQKNGCLFVNRACSRLEKIIASINTAVLGKNKTETNLAWKNYSPNDQRNEITLMALRMLKDVF